MVQGLRTLVVMTNGDVYYLSKGDAQELVIAVHDGRYPLFQFNDLKTNAKTRVSLRHISSIVEEVSRG